MQQRIPPLRKRTKEGTLYTRRPVIEEYILETLDLPFPAFMERARRWTRGGPDYVPSEVLVHRIRATRDEDTDDEFNDLYLLLTERIRRTCPRAEFHEGERISEIGEMVDIREVVLERFVTLILKDRECYEENLDIFEAVFDRAVMRLRYDAFRRVYRRDRPLTPLEDDEGDEVPDDVEDSLAVPNPQSMTPEEEVIYRIQVRRAIDTLPDIERRVVDMLEAGVPIESNDPNTLSIAGALGCTPKTVRNRRDRARRRIRERLGLEIHDDR